jgi:hypothetical protein
VSERHPSEGDLEQYVIGGLPRADHDRLEAHVAACARCGRALAKEARFEMALHAVARSAAAERTVVSYRSPRRRGAILAAGVLVAAAAAAVLLVARPWRSNDPVDREPRSASAAPAAANAEPATPSAYACVDSADVRRCIADAHHRGLAVTYPLAVPRYELAAATYLY